MHLTHELWEAVERGDIPPRFVVELAKQHFLTLCPVCAEEFQQFQTDLGRKSRTPGMGPAVSVLKEHLTRLQKEERAAQRDVADLLATPREKRHDKIQRARARYRGTAVVHALLDEYWKLIYADPEEAGHLADLAWSAAKVSHGVPRVHELMTLAASYIGNAARAAGDLPAADRWFGHVREVLDHEDVRTLSVLARIDCLEGSLRKDQRRFKEAEALLARALVLFRLTGMRLDIARTLLTFGATHFAQGRLKDAADKAREALLLVDRTADPRLYLLTDFTAADRAGSERVAVINQTAANLLWPGAEPLGRCVRMPGETDPCATVVGVVDDTRQQRLIEEPTIQLWVPLAQRPDLPPRALFARTTGPPAPLAGAVRRTWQAIAPDLPFIDVTPMTELLAGRIRPYRLGATVFSLFAALAVILAGLGLFARIRPSSPLPP